VTVFLQLFVIVGACYVGVFARGQFLRARRRWRRRREWRALDGRLQRGGSPTPPRPA
jgi:hypothetical protein